MTSVFNMIILQAFYYGLVMIFTLMFCVVLLRGFFVTYFQVRTGFGKYVLVKIRSPLRDYFAKGEVKEGFLIYKLKTGFQEFDTIRINIPPNAKIFYKCLGVTWVDVDDEKNAICQTDYSTVPGYDAVKNNNLHTRALMKPSIASGQEKILLFLIIIVGLLSIIAVYFSYSNAQSLNELTTNLPIMLKNLAGTVVGGKTV